MADTKECPYCAETIKAAAIKCRYCHSDLSAEVPSPTEAPVPAPTPAERTNLNDLTASDVPITSEVSRFDHVEEFQVDYEKMGLAVPTLDGPPILRVSGNIKEDPSTKTEIVTFFLILHAFSSEWRYSTFYDVIWLLDGEPFSFAVEGHQSGDALDDGNVVETVAFVVQSGTELDGLHAIARAQKVEYRLGLDEWVLTKEEQDALRAVLVYVQEHFATHAE